MNKSESFGKFKWVDTHCHLQLLDEELSGNDFENIEFLIIPGVDYSSSVRAQNLSSKINIETYWSAGLHPHDAKKIENEKESLKELFHQADLIGETGLDFYRNLSSREQQFENFLFHLEFSKKLNKPIIVHCRDSFHETYEMLVEFNNTSPVILHSWTGGRKWTKKFIDLGVYFSISGIVTYETAKDLQLSVKEIPINRLLLETDTPYLTPFPLKGRDNRPNYIEHTAQKISKLLNVNEKELSEITIKNSRNLIQR